MNILIDADGCPVVDLTLQIAKRFCVPVIILCDTAHQIEREGAQTLVFDKGADSVDFALVNRVKPGDVVVTQDYGLASMCLAKCARVLNQNGLEYTADNIDTLWENLTVGYDDLLTTPVVSELTGYSAQSIQRWCNQKILVGFKIRGTLTIPRLAVVEFMSGDRATAIVRKSSKHLDLLRTFAQDCHEGALTITY